MAGQETTKRCQRKTRPAPIAIQAACEKRVTVLDEELLMRKTEYVKEMEIKELKCKVFMEKLKYWQNKNECK